MAFWNRKKKERKQEPTAEVPRDGLPAGMKDPERAEAEERGGMPAEIPDLPARPALPEGAADYLAQDAGEELPAASSGTTVDLGSPERLLPEIANFQGQGSRAEQQDAFGLSPLADYAEKGLLAVLCDGMGGMAAGGEIARYCTQRILADFPLPAADAEISAFDERLTALCDEIFRRYGGLGGATLVLAYVRGGLLHFRCMGDSDLFLLRGDKIYALNEHQTYGSLRLREAIPHGLGPGLFGIPQEGALVSFLGCERPRLDESLAPLPLSDGDVLILCSDGVSGTLSRQDLLDACREDIHAGAEELDQKIREAARPNQDNYTAIICKFHDEGGSNHE